MTISMRKTGEGIEINGAADHTVFVVGAGTSSAHARALRAIFNELQVDGVVVIERPPVGKLSYEIDIKTTLNGRPYAAGFGLTDPLEHQDAVAADCVASITDRLADLQAPPFIVRDGVTYIRAASVEPVGAQIDEELAPQQVTNICSQVNNYGGDGLTEDRALEIIRNEIAKAGRPGGALWQPK